MRRMLSWTAAIALLVAAAGVAGAAPVLGARTIEVPIDYPTVQAAIDAASNGDTVVVDPGTYFENIDFKGKLITVQSAQGPSVTTLDGGGVAPVVNFSTGETSAAVLRGFTIQHGYATFAYQYMGGGVHINSASPTVAGNVITANSACGNGAGVSVSFSSPTIQDNVITGNAKQTGCSGDAGGGISVGGAAAAQILHNTITNNLTDFGGGISLNSAGTATLANNTIANNTAMIQGGGLWIVNQSDVTILQNLITGNTSSQSGGAVYLGTPSGTRGPLFVNNTFAGNSGSDSSLYLSGFDAQVQLTNNLITANSAQPTVLCDTTYSANPPMFDHNDLFNSAGPAAQGSCTGVIPNGNMSADPLFVSASDFHLQAASPAVDAGYDSVSLPASDLDGNPRVCGVAVDLGAYELQRPLALTIGSNVATVEGAGFSSVLGHFAGGYPPFASTASWGDGQSSPATISGSAVSGGHAYAEEGAYTVTVTMTDSTGATVTGTLAASAADAALAGAATAVSAVEGKTFSGQVAAFTDADPNGTVNDYSALIGWGDGSSSAGSIAADGRGGFTVNGTHTYAEEGGYTLTVSVSDAGGAALTASAAATVADAAVTASGGQFSVHHGSSFTVKVATLTDSDPGGVATDYTAVVSWGDGTSTSCPGAACTIVRQQNGTFAVSATHVYRQKGKFTVTVRLADAGGASVTTSSTITAT